MIVYQFTIQGTAADGQTWVCKGTVSSANEAQFPLLLEDALKGAFMQLTSGKAVFGKPGIGCRGPYKISEYKLERLQQ